MTPNPEDYDALVAYLNSCVRRRDWHGVRDAAVDLEIMEARNPNINTGVVMAGRPGSVLSSTVLVPVGVAEMLKK